MKLTTQSNPPTYVYVIHAAGTNRIKLGVSEQPLKRLRELQTGSPYQLRLIAQWPGNRLLETTLHERLGAYRVSGEWFEVPPFIGMLIFQIVHEQIKKPGHNPQNQQ